jgi:ribonuclease HII
MLICGIEEAGRGPVIGPLVMCGVVIDEKDSLALQKAGIKDSKALTPKQREGLVDTIKGFAKRFDIIVIPPYEIDAAVESDTLNLNWLEAQKGAEIINRLMPDKAIMDCPSTNTKAFAEYMWKHLANKGLELVAEHKADVNYPVVSAASILAKVARDAEIEKIKESIGKDFGSGYPSDPKTSDFLKKNFNRYPDIFRKSWAPYKALIGAPSQKKMSDF